MTTQSKMTVKARKAIIKPTAQTFGSNWYQDKPLYAYYNEVARLPETDSAVLITLMSAGVIAAKAGKAMPVLDAVKTPAKTPAAPAKTPVTPAPNVSDAVARVPVASVIFVLPSGQEITIS